MLTNEPHPADQLLTSSSYKWPVSLLALYLIVFTWSAINPFDYLTWFIENIPSVSIVLLLFFSYKKFKFSTLSYVLISIWITLHTIGAHYTFERVPFDWVTTTFDFTRNHFDRISHFSIGLFALPIFEVVYRKKMANFGLSMFIGFSSMGLLASGYEIIEFAYAVLFGGESAQHFLGSQGDIWDAQWDMTMDLLGATTAILILLVYTKFKKTTILKLKE